MNTVKTGDKSNAWKGYLVRYAGLHIWVRNIKGTPKKCEHCDKKDAKLYWANIDHKYKRVLEDFIGLCASCHKKYDISKFGVNFYRNNNKCHCLVCKKEFFKPVSAVKLGRGKYCSRKCFYERNKKKETNRPTDLGKGAGKMCFESQRNRPKKR